MAAGHVFHFKHGWIPLDHTDAGAAKGIRSRGDVARAVTTLPRVAPADRAGPKREIIHAASRTGSHDLLPSSWPKGAPRTPLSAEDIAEFKDGSAEAHLVTDADGSVHFTPERAALHQKIINGMLDGHEAQAHPRYHLMGGGPASGKSTMMDAIAADTGKAAVVNADDVKLALPEYAQQGNEGASFTHAESSYVAKQAMAEAFRRRVHVTLDGTGDSSVPSLQKKIDEAREAGYSVHGFYVTIPTEVAVQRAEKRAARSGRVVPRTVIQETHRNVSKVLPHMVDNFDSLTVYDNLHELTPILRKTSRGAKAQVLDDQLWRQFLAKANEG